MFKILRKNEVHRLVDSPGFTLMEIMITAVISCIGVATAFVLLSASYRFIGRGSEINQSNQELRAAIERMLRETREAARETVVIAGQNNSAISFALARNLSGEFEVDEDGHPVWQKAIVYYQKPDTSEMYRYEFSKTDWDSNFDPTDVINGGYGTIVARSISSIQFSLTLGRLLNIDITSIKSAKVGAVHTTHLNPHVVIRNTL